MTIFKTVFVLVLMSAFIAPTVHAQVGAQVEVGGGASAGVGNGASVDATTGVKAGATTSSPVQLREETGVPKNALGVEIRSSADVITNADLNAYENTILLTDSNIEDADSSSKQVSVAYWHPGRFLGIFALDIRSETKVTHDDESTITIKTHMPWWSFLVTGLGNVASSVQTELLASADFSANASASDNSQARARALEAIVAAHAHVSKK